MFQVLKARERRKCLWGPHTELRLSTDGADAEVFMARVKETLETSAWEELDAYVGS